MRDEGVGVIIGDGNAGFVENGGAAGVDDSGNRKERLMEVRVFEYERRYRRSRQL
jgi:hypothetical protein